MMNHAFHGLQSVARNGRKKKRKNVEKMLTAAENQVKDVEKICYSSSSRADNKEVTDVEKILAELGSTTLSVDQIVVRPWNVWN